jgi:hypothetical protein
MYIETDDPTAVAGEGNGTIVAAGEPGTWVQRTEDGNIMTVRLDGTNIIITTYYNIPPVGDNIGEPMDLEQ